MKTNSSNYVLGVVLLIVPLAVLGYLIFKKDTVAIETKPLPFKGEIDEGALTSYLKLSDGSDRQFYPVFPPDPSESKTRNIFTGRAR